MILVSLKVYNDADILEKVLMDRRRDLGPARDDDDAASPKLKISKSPDAMRCEGRGWERCRR